MPDRRTHIKLRSEVDGFIRLVRKLGGMGEEGDPAVIEATKSDMHKSVDRIASLAVEGGRDDSARQRAGGE
ncbi:MAG: hypothetical protein AMS21_11700 [Gemmatimonas sp. SG8_38_2]|nr:MAG: hypothetical protein AMS21_11700 [Gemmatimonas sp. SG8_38_2]